jgi:subtilisin family serine protease
MKLLNLNLPAHMVRLLAAIISVIMALLPTASPTQASSVETFMVNALISGEHGAVDPAAQTVNYGDNAILNITPDTGYKIDNITDNDVPAAITNPYVIDYIIADHDVIVTFSPVETLPTPASPVDTFIANASIFGEHGAVDPAGQTVNYGDNATINITPDTGFKIAEITDNGGTVVIANPYVIENVTTDHDVIVTFTNNNDNPDNNTDNTEIETLILRLSNDLSPEAQQQVILRNSGVETSSLQALSMYFIDVPAAGADEVIQRYQSDPQVLSIERNKVRQAEGMPSDPSYADQWALPQIGWDSVFGAIAPTGSSVIAVLDTGIDASQPDLSGLVLPGYSVFEGSDPLKDPNGHGTRVAGIAAARTDNGEGVSGVAYAGVELLPVQVLDSDGTGQDSDIINGLVWATDNGADVILIAFSNPGYSPALQAAIDYAWDKGVILVAAAGNDGSGTATYPAGDRGVIGVSATDQNDGLIDISNYGQTIFLAAPGVNILTTDLNNSYTSITGTSASAAIVAGSAALMLAVDPSLSNGVIVNRLALTADPAGTQEQTGNGRINLARALSEGSTDFIQPAGVPPLGEGGPYVGPYVIAAIKTFTGPGDFSDSTKWSGGTLPAAGDTLRIDGSCTFDNAASNLVYGSLTIGSITAGTLNWPAGGTNTLNVTALSSSRPGSALDMTNGGTIQVGNNNWATTNLTFTPGSGTIIWADTGGNSTIPAGLTTFNNLNIASTGRVVTLGAAITMNGNLLISAGTLDVSSSNFAVIVKGNFTNNGTFTPRSGTVTLNGTEAQTIGGTKSPTTFRTLTINKSSGTAALGVNITISANLTVSAGTFDLSTFTAPRTALGGTLTVASGATLKIGGTNTLPASYFTHTFNATSTIEYNGAAQTVSNENYAGNLTLSGSGIKTLRTGTTTIGGNFTLSGAATATTVAGLTINGNLIIGDDTTFTLAGFALTVAGATSLGDGTSGTLNINSATGAKTFAGLVTVNTGGAWNNSGNSAVTFRGGITSSGSFSAGSGVQTFNTNAQALTGTFSIPNVTVTGITLTNNGTLTVTSSLIGTGGLTNTDTGILNINFAGVAGITTLTAAASGNTVNYGYNGAQTIFPTNYHNLTTNTGGTITLAADLTVNGNLTIGSGTTLDVSTSHLALNVGGSWVNNGTFTARSGTVTMNGSNVQQMSGATTFYNLTLNNPSGLIINSAETVNKTLNLTSGNITTGSNKVIIAAGGVVSCISGYIIGNLQKNVAAGASTRTFEVGTENYNPVTVAFNNVAIAGDLTAQAIAGQHPDIGSSLIEPGRDVNVYWTLTNSGIIFNSYSATFNFTAGDINGSGDTANFSVGQYTGSWVYPNTGSRTSTSTQATGITSFGDFVVGEKNTPPSITLTAPASMTPQQQWTLVTATVTDPNTLADVNKVTVTIFYDSDKSHPAAPASADTQTCAILTWNRTSGWSIDQGAGATWTINTGGCTKPNDSLTSGDWVFSFKIGKVATCTSSASGWNVYASATDTEGTTGTDQKFDNAMAWYGEVSVSTLVINWGTVAPASDFTVNVQTGVTITYICNGNFQEQVMTTSPWLDGEKTVSLNASGTPGDGEFSLKANPTDTYASAQLLSSTAFTTIGNGTQTGESGVTVSTNTLWLKVGTAIPPDQYTGTIYFSITQ